MAKSRKEKKSPEPYWSELVSIYFSFCKDKFHDVPTFDGSSPRDLKAIIVALRKRCENSGNEWNYESATGRLKHFLEHCFLDKWLSDNFLLSNINRQKDKIFYNITRQYLAR